MKIINLILGLPKTLRFNFKYFNLRTALKFPVVISNNVRLKNINGKVKIDAPIGTGMIKLGFGDVGIFDERLEKSIFQVSGTIIFKGKCDLGHGFRISTSKTGTLTFGNEFKMTANSTIVCNERVTFGEKSLMSWDCLIMDTDFHKIYNEDGLLQNENKDIYIGNQVWICSRCSLFKGTFIDDGSVLGAGSIISSKFNEKNILLLGNPAKKIKRDIKWSL
jgi:acetyltransferase-like isoleucine patch superfamily enzyme